MKRYIYVDERFLVIACFESERSLCRMVSDIEITDDILKDLFDEEGNPNYIYFNDEAYKGISVEEFNQLKGGFIRKLTDDEKAYFFPEPLPPQPTQLDRIESLLSKKEEDIIDNYTLSLINYGIII